MNRRLAVLVAHCSLLIALTACGGEPPPVPPRPSPTPTLQQAASTGDRAVTDMMNRLLQLPAVVDRVVAISPSALEFATSLGLTVLGRPSDVTLTGSNSAIAAVGSTINPDFAAIAALRPQLVIADAAYHSGRLRDFEKFPIPVFILRANSYADVLAALSALGEATGHADRAVALRDGIETKATAVVARTAARPPVTVLVLTGSGKEVFAGSDSTYLGSLVLKLGGKNVLGADPQGAPIAGFGLVDVGQVATRNPDVVLALNSGSGGLGAQVRNSPAWANNSAVRNNRVFEVDTALFLRSPGPRVADALEQLAAMLYPNAR